MEAEIPDEERKVLLAELSDRGIKHDPDNVIAASRDGSGRVVFLELGNGKAGLKHILDRHGEDFAHAGIARDAIPDLVIIAATRGIQVGMQRTRPVFRVQFNGVTRYVGVTVGDNGFVVGANPVSSGLYETREGEGDGAEDKTNA